MHYDVAGKMTKVDMPVPGNVVAELDKILESKESGEFKEYISEWAQTLSQPIPHIRRTAIDIEITAERDKSVESIIDKGENPITAISFKGDGIDRVLALGDPADAPKSDGFELVLYRDENDMLQDAFHTMEEYPVILTYNGMNFDLPYMKSRADFLKSKGRPTLDVPFHVHKTNGAGQATHIVTFRKCIHVDLYNIMDNLVFQNYVFDKKYTKKGLDDVSRAILGYGKIEHDVFGEQDVGSLARYCYHDSMLTYELTAHQGDMLMNMLVIISRIANMPLDDVARYRVSQWIRSRLYYHHRRKKFLIPNRSGPGGQKCGHQRRCHNEGEKIPRRIRDTAQPRHLLWGHGGRLCQPVPKHNQGVQHIIRDREMPARGMPFQHAPAHQPLVLHEKVRHDVSPDRVAAGPAGAVLQEALEGPVHPGRDARPILHGSAGAQGDPQRRVRSARRRTSSHCIFRPRPRPSQR